VNFWDSSAIVPLLIAQPPTEKRSQQLREDETILVWWGTSTECVSALQRLLREGTANDDDLSRAIARLDGLASSWTEVEPTNQVRLQAERLLRTHPLRAADALQLAAAIIGADYEPDGMGFYTSDTRLAEAAAKEGFKVA
jgi:predicted nucleic acid-binding protein